jgi:ribonuclease HI
MSTHPSRRSLPADKLRMVRRSDPENEILIFTSGQMMKKIGKKQQKDFAGCAVIYMPKGDPSGHRSDCIGFSIEDRGPNGEFFNPESKRADLRAVVAALEFKVWSSEGWSRVTIASDSRYVCEGITKHIVGWRKKGWLDGKAHPGRTAKNLDLWTRLLDLINGQAYHGCEVAFWHINPEQNKQARLVAEAMAKGGERSEEYRAFGNVGLSYLDG